MPSDKIPSPPGARRVTARALLLGARIAAAGLERPDIISTNPLAFRTGAHGFVAIYRFGVAVFIDLSPLEEEEILRLLDLRIAGKRDRLDDETAALEVFETFEDRVAPGGPIQVPDLSPQRLLVISDALAKTVALGRDEREVNAVFDVIEPFAANLAATGRPPGRRRAMLKLIGQALLAQHRVSGRIAVDEKPDVLWDRPDLERLFARLDDEYELRERGDALKRKLDVIVETTRAITDVIDADRSTRLEITIVALIVIEIALSVLQMAGGLGLH